MKSISEIKKCQIPTGHWKATGHFFGKFIWKILYKNLDLKGGGYRGRGVRGGRTVPVEPGVRHAVGSPPTRGFATGGSGGKAGSGAKGGIGARAGIGGAGRTSHRIQRPIFEVTAALSFRHDRGGLKETFTPRAAAFRGRWPGVATVAGFCGWLVAQHPAFALCDDTSTP